MLARTLTLVKMVIALVKDPETEIFLIRLAILIILIFHLAQLLWATFR